MPVVKAQLKYLRIAPRKVRLVADMLRKKGLGEAEKNLKFAPKRAAQPLAKLLASAKANARNNFNMEIDNLYVKEIRVDQGPVLKRYMPRAYGRASMIRKKSSHVTLVLAERK